VCCGAADGVVLLNPSNATDERVPLGGEYIDPTTNSSVTAATLEGPGGAIFLKKWGAADGVTGWQTEVRDTTRGYGTPRRTDLHESAV